MQKEVDKANAQLADSQIDAVIQSGTPLPEISTTAPVIPPPPAVLVEAPHAPGSSVVAPTVSGKLNGAHHVGATDAVVKSETKTGV